MRSPQDSNLCGQSPSDFESDSLTTRTELRLTGWWCIVGQISGANYGALEVKYDFTSKDFFGREKPVIKSTSFDWSFQKASSYSKCVCVPRRLLFSVRKDIEYFMIFKKRQLVFMSLAWRRELTLNTRTLEWWLYCSAEFHFKKKTKINYPNVVIEHA